MQHKLTILIDDDVYRGLYAKIGARRIGRFLSDLARPHVIELPLDEGYKTMAADKSREDEAMEWIEASIADLNDR